MIKSGMIWAAVFILGLLVIVNFFIFVMEVMEKKKEKKKGIIQSELTKIRQRIKEVSEEIDNPDFRNDVFRNTRIIVDLRDRETFLANQLRN
jgi:predicted membrane protein